MIEHHGSDALFPIALGMLRWQQILSLNFLTHLHLAYWLAFKNELEYRNADGRFNSGEYLVQRVEIW